MILVDNTVLSNFALVDELPLLKQFCKGLGATSGDVLSEFGKGVQEGYFKNADFPWLTKLDLNTEIERAMFTFLCQRLGAGEASCLVLAIQRKFDFLSDDLMVRKMALREGIRVSGSIGVLIELIHKNVIPLARGNELLKGFIKQGFFSPVERLDHFIKTS
jgi:predicted nucleic acid-binding protein